MPCGAAYAGAAFGRFWFRRSICIEGFGTPGVTAMLVSACGASGLLFLEIEKTPGESIPVRSWS